jgi:hypothetical protein
MSLNRSEQMVFDYIQAHPEERHYWVDKVRKTSAGAASAALATDALEGEFWRYFEERSAVVSPFRDEARSHGLRRTSMKNLAEYVLRLWAPPRPKRPSPPLVE